MNHSAEGRTAERSHLVNRDLFTGGEKSNKKVDQLLCNLHFIYTERKTISNIMRRKNTHSYILTGKASFNEALPDNMPFMQEAN